MVRSRFIFAALIVLSAPALFGFGDAPIYLAVAIDSPFDERSARFSEELLGTWRLPNRSAMSPPTTLTLRRAVSDRRRYEVLAPWYFAHPVPARVYDFDDGWVMELAMDVRPENEGLFFPARHFWGVKLDGNALTVVLLSVQVGYLVRSGTFKLPYELAAGTWVLTGTPDQIKDALRLGQKRVKAPWVLTFERSGK